MIDKIVMIERLLDHQQVEKVQCLQMFLIRQGIGAVSIHGKKNIGIASPHFSHDIDIPAGFNLELNSLITSGQVPLYPIEKLIEIGLNAEADTHGHARAYASYQLRQ